MRNLSAVLTDEDDSNEMSFEQLLDRIESRLGDKIGHWVKAVFDSSMGQLGTVGVLAVEEFFTKLKSVFQEALAAQATVFAPLPDVAPRHSADLAPLDSSSVGFPAVRCSSGTGSIVPTVFGDAGSVSAVGDVVARTPAAVKPGNGLQDHM